MIIIKKRSRSFSFEKTPRLRIGCKLDAVQYWEWRYGILFYGQLREQASWIKSCAVIGYLSGLDGAILPAQDYPPCPTKFPRKPCDRSFIDQVCLVKMAGYCPCSFFLRVCGPQLCLSP